MHTTNFPFMATTNVTVGIIGAGVTGLYSALLLQSLGINYQILEANTRAGGRIWTHYFDPDAWSKSRPGEPEYYDYFVRCLISTYRLYSSTGLA